MKGDFPFFRNPPNLAINISVMSNGWSSSGLLLKSAKVFCEVFNPPSVGFPLARSMWCWRSISNNGAPAKTQQCNSLASYVKCRAHGGGWR